MGSLKGPTIIGDPERRGCDLHSKGKTWHYLCSPSNVRIGWYFLYCVLISFWLSILCNLTVLLYFSFPAFPNSHFLSLYHIRLSPTLSLALAHCSFPFFLFPSRRLICQGYIIFVLLLLGQTPSPSPSTQPLSQSSVTTGRSMEEVRRVMGLSNSPTWRQAYTSYVCVFFCVCR